MISILICLMYFKRLKKIKKQNKKSSKLYIFKPMIQINANERIIFPKMHPHFISNYFHFMINVHESLNKRTLIRKEWLAPKDITQASKLMVGKKSRVQPSSYHFFIICSLIISLMC